VEWKPNGSEGRPRMLMKAELHVDGVRRSRGYLAPSERRQQETEQVNEQSRESRLAGRGDGSRLPLVVGGVSKGAVTRAERAAMRGSRPTFGSTGQNVPKSPLIRAYTRTVGHGLVCKENQSRLLWPNLLRRMCAFSRSIRACV
jgi:hypothetical protein